MTNEYYEKFQELQDRETFRGETWFGERKKLVEKYSWAVPNDEVLTYLSEFDHLFEAGAGNGYWASLLEDRGVIVEAFDESPPQNTYTNVEQADVLDVYHKLEDESVLTVWPPLGEMMATQVVQAKPSHLLYVGEKEGGCTGNETFFEYLGCEYGLVARIELPSYAGVHDDFYHYVRKR